MAGKTWPHWVLCVLLFPCLTRNRNQALWQRASISYNYIFTKWTPFYLFVAVVKNMFGILTELLNELVCLKRMIVAERWFVFYKVLEREALSRLCVYIYVYCTFCCSLVIEIRLERSTPPLCIWWLQVSLSYRITVWKALIVFTMLSWREF